jgi:hypothetical protein
MLDSSCNEDTIAPPFTTTFSYTYTIGESGNNEQGGTAHSQTGQQQSATAAGNTVEITTLDPVALTISLESRTGVHSFRDNNPGDIKVGNFADNDGAIGDDKGIAIFPTSQEGFAALGALPGTSKNQRLAVDQAISECAPPSQNDTAAYQASIRNVVGGQWKHADIDVEQRTTWEHGIVQHEGFYSSGAVKTQTISIPGLLQASP